VTAIVDDDRDVGVSGDTADRSRLPSWSET
jgi:hypothetical protein